MFRCGRGAVRSDVFRCGRGGDAGGARRCFGGGVASLGGCRRRWPRRAATRVPGVGRSAAWRRAEFLLERREPGDQLVDGNERRASRESDEEHLEAGARLSAPDDIVEPRREALMQADEVVDGRSRGELDHVAPLEVREVQ